MKTFRIGEIAARAGVHPNTVRFYEEQGLLPAIPRTQNGYRLFSEYHLLQLRLIRCAFRAEIVNHHLRQEAISIVKSAAAGDLPRAASLTTEYRAHIHSEILKAEEAISVTEQLLHRPNTRVECTAAISRREAAAHIGISIHVLRDWERNGLIASVQREKRKEYDPGTLKRMKVISLLRHAGYSQMAIRRMLKRLETGETDLRAAIDTPDESEDIVSVADRYITALSGALEDVEEMLQLLTHMNQKAQTLQ